MSYAQEHLDRRDRLGMGTPKPIVKASVPSAVTPAAIAELVNEEVRKLLPTLVKVEVEKFFAKHFKDQVSDVMRDTMKEELARLRSIQEAADAAKEKAAKSYEWEAIVKAVCDRHEVQFEHISGIKRTREIADARMEAIYLLSIQTPLSIAEIGRLMNRDHSTIRKAIDTHKRKMKFEAAYK